MQTSKMDRKKSQQSLGRKPAGISLTGCVNSPETLQRKRVAQPRQRRESSSNKFPAAEPLLGPAPRTGCGRAHPAGAAKFWPSTSGCAGIVPGHSASQFEHRWDPWDSCAPPAGARRTTSFCTKGTAFGYCLPITPSNWRPITGDGRAGCRAHPLRVPLGLISSASHVLRRGHLSPPLFSFSHFQ